MDFCDYEQNECFDTMNHYRLIRKKPGQRDLASFNKKLHLKRKEIPFPYQWDKGSSAVDTPVRLRQLNRHPSLSSI